VTGLGGVIALVTIDLRPVIEFAAFRMLDRRLSIGTLKIGWGSPLSVELTDLRLANASWGSDPEMFSIGALSADIDLHSLLHGVLRYDKLRIGQSQLLLERSAGGDANWRFAGGGPAAQGQLAILPKDRTQFPTLLDLALHEGSLIYRVPGKRDLRLAFHDLTIRSPGDDQTVTLAVDGAYNGVPVRLAGTTEAFSVMRDRLAPFGSQWTLSTAAGMFAFKGTMTDPLNFDGVEGKTQIEVSKLGEFLTFVGTDFHWDVPLHLAGTFTRQSEHWQLSDSTGAIAKNRFDGTLALTEAGRGQPDAVALDLAFAELDLKTLFANDQAMLGTASARDAISLHIEENPGATVDARIAAKRLAYGTMQVADFAIHGSSAPGAVSVGALTFSVAGGRVAASGSAHAVKAGTRIAASIGLSGGDAGEIAALAGAAPGQIAGKLDGRATLEVTGQTLADALKPSRGQAVLAMSDGQVARDFIEKASTDLRALFRTGEGWVPASCLLGVVELRDGVATIVQLRMRTPDTTLVGSGEADLAAGRLDMTIKADSAGSKIFALDVPLHIAGAFATLSVRPAIGSPSAAPREASPGHRLPAELQALVENNPCRSK
jgi:AsmA family protein